MSMKFPNVPLSQVLTPIERPEAPQPGTTYRLFGVKWWGEGVYEREAVDGSQTQYAKLSRIEANDIVINKIWARHGSVAVVQEHLAGCYGGSEFPTFLPDPTQLEPRWIHWLSKTASFWAWCAEKSYGTSGKNRIRPEQFLAVEIPLPSLDEQHRIIAHIEALAARIAEARGLRQQAVKEADQLIVSETAALLSHSNWEETPIGNLLREDTQNGLFAQRPSDVPPGIPILRISAGTSRPDALIDESDYKYVDIDDKTLQRYKVEPGDLFACRYNGNLRFVGKFSQYSGYLGQTHIYPDKLIRFRVDTTRILPEFTRLAMNSPLGRSRIEAHCATTAGNIGISASRLKTVLAPVPPLVEQHRIVAYLDNLHARVDTIKRLQAETTAELDALLPAVLDRAFRGEL